MATVMHAPWLPGAFVALWLQGPVPFTHMHTEISVHLPPHCVVNKKLIAGSLPEYMDDILRTKVTLYYWSGGAFL